MLKAVARKKPALVQNFIAAIVFYHWWCPTGCNLAQMYSFLCCCDKKVSWIAVH